MEPSRPHDKYFRSVFSNPVQIWLPWRNREEDERGLPLIVPLVLYQGADPWQYDREFAELFANAASEWRWVPRFEHLLIDQTEEPGFRPGSLGREARANRDDGCVSGRSGSAARRGDAVRAGRLM